MTISRWKIMAGMLGVSLGGLVAIAGQTPKPTTAKAQAADEMPIASPPQMVPGGCASSKPVASTASSLPTPVLLAPSMPATALSAATLPAAPPMPMATPLPLFPTTTEPQVVVGALGMMIPAQSAVIPVAGVVYSPPGAVPACPAQPDEVRIYGTPMEPSVPGTTLPPSTSTDPVQFRKTIGTTLIPPAPAQAAALPMPAIYPTTTASATTPALPELSTATTTTAVAVTKHRVLLRVGEGDPSFEVRHGDELMMKVVCDKVDIKSPEKGAGQSMVTATGKVRFVGFGAEGTCDQLSFRAGTGEVSMCGTVKIQVKDKLGRVESELTSDKMQYKLDTSMPISIKP